jgi:hypothetical protein
MLSTANLTPFGWPTWWVGRVLGGGKTRGPRPREHANTRPVRVLRRGPPGLRREARRGALLGGAQRGPWSVCENTTSDVSRWFRKSGSSYWFFEKVSVAMPFRHVLVNKNDQLLSISCTGCFRRVCFVTAIFVRVFPSSPMADQP